jgi:hypothetical protein
MKKMIIATTVLALLATSGCVMPHYNDGNITPSGWRGVCDLRPIVVTNAGQTRWDNARVSRYTQWLEPAYRNASLTFRVLPTEKLESSEWFSIDEKADFYAMSEVSMERSKSGELVIWFVDKIPVWNAGGVAQYPSNAPGKYQHGIAIAYNSSEAALIHEVGHSFNLPHTWKDLFTDTPTTDKSDCTTEPCNAMTYCSDKRLPKGSCLGKTFSAQQISEIQKWASVFPRNQVVDAINVPPGVFVTYTDNKEPQVD